MKLRLGAASVVLLASVSAACAGVHARTQPDGPPLDVPPPPSVVIAAEPEPSAVRPPPAPADAPLTNQKSAPTIKIEKPDKTEPPPAAPVKPATGAAPPAASLQTTANVEELEKKIRGLLARATGDLDGIVVKILSADGRAQYDEARRFAEQAEAALKVQNLAFAEQLADKAATLASLLAKR